MMSMDFHIPNSITTCHVSFEYKHLVGFPTLSSHFLSTFFSFNFIVIIGLITIRPLLNLLMIITFVICSLSKDPFLELKKGLNPSSLVEILRYRILLHQMGIKSLPMNLKQTQNHDTLIMFRVHIVLILLKKRLIFAFVRIISALSRYFSA